MSSHLGMMLECFFTVLAYIFKFVRMCISMRTKVTNINSSIITFITAINFPTVCTYMFSQVQFGKIPFATHTPILTVITLESWMVSVL